MPERILWWFMDKTKKYTEPVWPILKWILILIPFGIPLLLAIGLLKFKNQNNKE
jgi:hypothetical protein